MSKKIAPSSNGDFLFPLKYGKIIIINHKKLTVKDLQGKLVAVLGFGVEGKAVSAYLLKHGIKPVLFDQKPWELWRENEQEEIKSLSLNFIFGPDCLKELAGFDFAFRSPGVKLSDIYNAIDKNSKLVVSSQTKWFFEHCPAKIIGVTGTKGKGTTCALIYQMLLADGKNACLTGNIGKTPPLKILDQLKPQDWVVYELSSFQLQDLGRSPHIGVVLMTTSEHLDYHQNTADYVQAKSSICQFQTGKDFCIFNNDYQNSVKLGTGGAGTKLKYSTRQNADCCINEEKILLNNAAVINVRDIKLKGSHNLQNICAAVLASTAAGCSQKAIQTAVVNFNGLEHRLQFVGESQHISFYNDSFSTTPETAIAAIKSFTEPLIVILGGSTKHADFLALGLAISQSPHIKALILIGEESARIRQAIANQPRILEGAKNMDEIFLQIKSVAEPGDVVLLSPACASFDMFKNYQDRGEQFQNHVNNF